MTLTTALALLVLTAAPHPVDDPVDDVAAFFLERCDGVKPKEKARCDAAVARNRAGIAARRYASRIQLKRLEPGALKVKPFDAQSKSVKLDMDLVIKAEEMAEAQSACLSLGKQTAEVHFADASKYERWYRRMQELLGRRSMWLELVFEVGKEGPVQGRRCALGDAKGVRVLDGESGEVLAFLYKPPSGEGDFEARRLHATLEKGGTQVDPLERYLSLVREKVSRHFAMVGAKKQSEANARLYIDADGKLLKAQVDPSGDPTFDKAVSDALRKASPLPPPPTDLRRRLKEQGVVMQFKR